MPAGILTFKGRFGHSDPRRVAAKHPSSVGDKTPPTGNVAIGPAVLARVSGGCWIADCPQIGCAGAEFVSFENPVFFCCGCRNAGVGHDLLPVLVPSAKARGEIENVLLERPAPETRHWMPGETVEKLRAENEAQGEVG